MSQCLNPDCLRQNPTDAKFCTKCGNRLLLSERYRAIKIIEQGGFGRTFLAVDEQKPLKPRCVIKQFLPQGQGTQNTKKAAQLFGQEAVRLNELGHHDQIPELMAYVTQDERQYLVQEFIDGQNLASELKESSSVFTETQIRELLNDLLPVLEFIHNGKVIHRDIKPENIIRRQRDNKLVLVDFGAAKVVTGTALINTGTSIGSPEFIAPEQSMGKAVFASDLYSLGVTCIHLITNQYSPFVLFDTNENTWVWRQFLVNNPVSDNLGHILDKLIQKAVPKRYQSVAEVLKDLNSPQSVQQQSTKPINPVINITTPPAGPKDYRERITRDVWLEMIAIPGGSFIMGSPSKERHSNECPQHHVEVPGFYMSKYPVTNAQWRALMRTNPASTDIKFAGLNQPVINVNWNDSQDFCHKLFDLFDRKYRLPSEAEWEYACRAGTTNPFYFGENIRTEQVNYNGNYPYKNVATGEYRQETTEVGKFPANSFGLYDMHGNVWEWCEDKWHKNYEGAPIDGSAWLTNNSSNRNQNMRMLRGGSWYEKAESCRSASRFKSNPTKKASTFGFRVAFFWLFGT